MPEIAVFIPGRLLIVVIRGTYRLSVIFSKLRVFIISFYRGLSISRPRSFLPWRRRILDGWRSLERMRWLLLAAIKATWLIVSKTDLTSTRVRIILVIKFASLLIEWILLLLVGWPAPFFVLILITARLAVVFARGLNPKRLFAQVLLSILMLLHRYFHKIRPLGFSFNCCVVRKCVLLSKIFLFVFLALSNELVIIYFSIFNHFFRQKFR
jgi:hypothetical protein